VKLFRDRRPGGEILFEREAGRDFRMGFYIWEKV